jgi:MYXO-CTERM domain-containing protein
VEPVIVLPSGEQIAGEPWCLPPPEEPSTGTEADPAPETEPALQSPRPPASPEAQGCGCALGGPSPAGAVAGLVLLVTLRSRGRRRA